VLAFVLTWFLQELQRLVDAFARDLVSQIPLPPPRPATS
jgi:hypothetical protein